MMDLSHFLKDTCVTYLILSNLIISLLPPCHIIIASTLYLYCFHISNQVPVPDQSSGNVASIAAHCRLQLPTTGPSYCLLII